MYAKRIHTSARYFTTKSDKKRQVRVIRFSLSNLKKQKRCRNVLLFFSTTKRQCGALTFCNRWEHFSLFLLFSVHFLLCNKRQTDTASDLLPVNIFQPKLQAFPPEG